MPNDQKTPMYGECKDCGHYWPALYIPMELSKVVEVLKRAHCPMCGVGFERLVVYEPGRIPSRLTPEEIGDV